MLQVTFVLAVILAAEGVVLAHPISYARRNEPLSIVPRDNNQIVNSARPFSMENLYEEIVNSLMKDQDLRHRSTDTAVTPVHRNQNWFGIRGYDANEVERRGLSDREGEEKMERRELDDGLMGLAVRESGDGGELDARDFEEGPALMPRGGKNKKNRRGGKGGGKGGNKEGNSNLKEGKNGDNNELPVTDEQGKLHGHGSPATDQGYEPPATGNEHTTLPGNEGNNGSPATDHSGHETLPGHEPATGNEHTTLPGNGGNNGSPTTDPKHEPPAASKEHATSPGLGHESTNQKPGGQPGLFSKIWNHEAVRRLRSDPKNKEMLANAVGHFLS